MKNKFNIFMKNNKKFMENINLVGEIFNKLLFSIAIAIVTIFFSIAANDISKTSNDIAKVSNSISQQNLEFSKEQTSPFLEFDSIKQNEIKKYKIFNEKGIVKDFDARLEIIIKIRSKTTGKMFESKLISTSIQADTDKSWMIDGENLNLDINKYTDDIEAALLDEITNDNFFVINNKIIKISYRDFSNDFYTEYYVVNGDKIKYDNNLTNNYGEYSGDKVSVSMNEFLTKDFENKHESDKYKKNIEHVVDLIKRFN